jgi:hypothetical protein
MVAFDKMKDKLLTLDQVQEKIASTEPLGQTLVTNLNEVTFAFEPTWAIGLEDKPDTEVIEATVTIDGEEHPLTKEAALQVGAEFGYTGKLASVTPSWLLEQNLNYWWNAGMGDKEFNVLSTGDNQAVAALTRPTIQPFSNALLVERTIDAIQDRYGRDTEIFADYKFNHSLTRTDIRFIIPDAIRHISGGGMTDVPSGERDEWAGGVHLTNSLIGKSQTKLETYLFRWWCTNGATTTMENVGQVFSRRGDHGDLDVYAWAQAAVDDVLGGFEDQFDLIQALTNLNLGSNTGEVVAEIFDTFRVPVTQRRHVLNILEDVERTPELNMYVVMNAITQTANEPGLSEDRIDKILRIGGAVPGATFNSLKAKLWDEGHTADNTAVNPYRLQTA